MTAPPTTRYVVNNSGFLINSGRMGICRRFRGYLSIFLIGGGWVGGG